MVTWVLERDLSGDGTDERIAAHVRGLGLRAHLLRVAPFSWEIEGRVPRVEGPVVFHGSIGARAVCARHGWTPGVWTGPGFSEGVARGALGDLYLNADAVTVPLSRVPDVAPDAFFVKPDADAKDFAGFVTTRDAFGPWFAEMRSIGYLDGTDVDVVVSSIKDVGPEHRLVVVDGTVVTATLYRSHGRSVRVDADPAAFQAFADRVAARHAPAEVHVLDVTTLDGIPKVIEFNTFNSAGIYASDVGRVVDAVTAFVARTHAPTHAASPGR